LTGFRIKVIDDFSCEVRHEIDVFEKQMKQNIIKFLCAVVLGALAFTTTLLALRTRLIIGSTLTFSSLVLTIISRRQLGTSFSRKAKAETLVTSGLYSRIRHPLYLFVDLTFLGLIIAFNVPIVLILWFVLVVVQLRQSIYEERILAEVFHGRYEKYKACTWF
jgi:protein-S-isoprenylcysteine O-methyltransferase Ste14